MKHSFSVAILPLLLAGCAATPPAEVTASRDPADIKTDIRPNRYRSPVSGYQHRDPVDPKPWRKLNEDVTSESEGAS
jgi:hypothetical protein